MTSNETGIFKCVHIAAHTHTRHAGFYERIVSQAMILHWTTWANEMNSIMNHAGLL